MLILLALLQTTSPVLDGTVAPGEWGRPSHVAGTSSLETWLMSTDSSVYVAVRGTGDGFPHLAIARGDTVLILHASAALGTAVYTGQGSRKRLIQPFTFAVRSPKMDPDTDAERERFFAREGWVASTILMGNRGESEFRIARWLLGSGARILVAYWSEQGGVQHWPQSIANDGAIREQTVKGFLADTLEFRPEAWAHAP